jgi:hypothetical protein
VQENFSLFLLACSRSMYNDKIYTIPLMFCFGYVLAVWLWMWVSLPAQFSRQEMYSFSTFCDYDIIRSMEAPLTVFLIHCSLLFTIQAWFVLLFQRCVIQWRHNVNCARGQAIHLSCHAGKQCWDLEMSFCARCINSAIW